ncbi:hypothetical protein N0V82_000684 [Gnomoniopsis sp. IMI 355080]|nr:hypothetical protein N0V82_000684 [Gnomoniopsis sp. IMI 355080]
MRNQCSLFDKVIMTWWATVWCAILGSWPALASAVPLERRQQDDSSSGGQQQTASQGLIAGLSAGVAVAVLTGIVLVICFPPRKWARGRATRPVKPYIQQTTTTTVTHSRSGSSESTTSLTESAAPLPMTRITNIDKRGRYIISSKEAAVAAAADAESDVAGPSSRRPPASLQRYSVHVTSNGGSTTSLKGGGSLTPLSEESGSSAARFPKQETNIPVTPTNWPINTMILPSASTLPPTPGRSVIADRRGRPALQSIQVPSPSSPANAKGKGKARLYYH